MFSMLCVHLYLSLKKQNKTLRVILMRSATRRHAIAALRPLRGNVHEGSNEIQIGKVRAIAAINLNGCRYAKGKTVDLALSFL